MKNSILFLSTLTILVIMIFILTGCSSESENKDTSSKENISNNLSSSNEVELYPVKDEETNLYGYVNNKGEWVVEPKYVSAWGFDNETGLAKTRMPKGDYSVSFIDKNGKTVLDGYGSYSSHSFCNGYAVVDTNVRVDTYTTKMLIDKDENIIIPSGKYERMTDVSKDGIIGVAESTVSGMKYMKLDGTIIIEKKYEYGNDIADASMVNEKGYAYAGSTIFDMQGNEIKANGKVLYLNDNNYGFVENNNYMCAAFKLNDGSIEYITDFIFDNAKGYNNINYSMVNEENGKPYYLINEKGEKVNDNTYKAVSTLLDGKWVVTLEDGKHQVLNADGSILVNTF